MNMQKRHFPVERDFINVRMAVWRAALVTRRKRLDQLPPHTSPTRSRAVGASIWLIIEPDILLAWARWHRANVEIHRKRKPTLREALAIADRCEFRLKQAEIHNFLARLALDAGEREAAREQAEIAKGACVV